MVCGKHTCVLFDTIKKKQIFFAFMKMSFFAMFIKRKKREDKISDPKHVLKIRFCVKRHILKSFLTKVCQKALYNRVKVSLLSKQ